MTELSEVLAKVRAVDDALAQRGVDSAASEAIREQLVERALGQPREARPRWWPMLTFAAGAATVAALFVLRDLRPPASITTTTAAESGSLHASEHAQAEPVTQQTCAALEPGPRPIALGECQAVDGVRVSALAPSRLSRAGDRIELIAGEVLFTVSPRPHAPLWVSVGPAMIEVVGTRFVVHRGDDGGWISMIDGQVRVDLGEQDAVVLDRGGHLDWPGSAGPAAHPVDASEGPAAAQSQRELDPVVRPSEPVEPADDGLAALLDEVAALRRAGRFADAVDRLRQAEAADGDAWTARSRQIVSFEIGSLLERQLRDSEVACAHWADHRARYPAGRYDAIVVRAMDQLGCAD